MELKKGSARMIVLVLLSPLGVDINRFSFSFFNKKVHVLFYR